METVSLQTPFSQFHPEDGPRASTFVLSKISWVYCIILLLIKHMYPCEIVTKQVRSDKSTTML